MENIEKETASSKFMENPYIEMKKKISVNGIVALVIAILAFVGSSAVSDTQSSLKLFLIMLGAGLLIYGLIRVAVGNRIAVCRATGTTFRKRRSFTVKTNGRVGQFSIYRYVTAGGRPQGWGKIDFIHRCGS